MLKIQQLNDGTVEISSIFEEGGTIIRCFQDGRIELFEIPHYGGREDSYGNYPTICAALEKAKTFT